MKGPWVIHPVLSELSAFRDQFYGCPATRAEPLFELTSADRLPIAVHGVPPGRGALG